MGEPLLLVGCGNMGFSLLQGWLAAGAAAPEDVYVVEPSEMLRDRACQLGVAACSTVDELAPGLQPRLIVLAVKPQSIAEIAPAYARFAGTAAYVSIAAGVTTARLESMLGDVAILRAMPNTPTSLGKGSTVVFANSRTDGGTRERVVALLRAGGSVHFVDREELIDAATAISGSGPAYVFLFIECLARRAATLGLGEKLALDLARETVAGAAALAMSDTSQHPAHLREKVTSPNGTTAAALEILLADDALDHLLGHAVDAARRRSASLSGEV
ncbi:pyrroline-5-carboxylate reductase [Ancylobacter mangrovi]|uniref:pyrroline-5-carboxylate reductase n=1 Tax=Ancylobacter mangrovi TaxID=2972472 RepID=UPI002161B8C9|nr:pyrroline-5-carboxylate reductase [Ancylobacter mangrovi]MCS0505172.1 pyrroline-5-carboxylate reductase [Ancylobacter mangrovi]